MTAKEAKEKAALINTQAVGGQYSKIIELVKKAVDKGEYETWFYEFIREDVRVKLLMDGYDVGETKQDRDGTLTKITWR